MTDVWLRLSPHDILFFRGSQPFTAGETGYLRSEFPPTPQVIQGAVRSGLLQANGVSWEEYYDGTALGPHQRSVVEAVGRPGQQEEMGIDLHGPFLLVGPELYLPAPLDAYLDDDAVVRGAPDDMPTVCDLGSIRLPSPPRSTVQPLAGSWMSADGITAYLTGGTFSRDELFDPFETPAGPGHSRRAGYEPKVGLALDAASRTAREGMLYTIAPLRLGEELAFAVRTAGIPESAALPRLLPLGGEGRFAMVDAGFEPSWPDHRSRAADAVNRSHRFRLLFVQPAFFEDGWLPPGFQQVRRGASDAWEGHLNGLSCRLISASLDRPRKVGGWDIHANRPKPVRSLVPAGSVYYFETDEAGSDVIEALDNRKLGTWTRIGFGHCLVGEWG